MSDDLDPRELVESDDPGKRAWAVRVVGERGSDEALRVLIDALSDPSRIVARAAADVLSETRGEAVVPRVAPALLESEGPGEVPRDDPRVIAVTRIAGPETPVLLADALAETRNPGAVARIAAILGALGDPRARPPLEEAMAELEERTGEEAERAVRAAASALHELDRARERADDLPDLEAIRGALESGVHDDRLRAERRLGEWARIAEAETLRGVLDDPLNPISWAAAEALGIRGDRESIPALVREVAKVKRCVAADAAAYAYAEAGDVEHGAHARALVRIRAPEAVPALVDALEGASNPWVTWEIAWVLGRLGDPAAAPAVSRELEALEERGGSGWRHRERARTLEGAVVRLREEGDE